VPDDLPSHRCYKREKYNAFASQTANKIGLFGFAESCEIDGANRGLILFGLTTDHYILAQLEPVLQRELNRPAAVEGTGDFAERGRSHRLVANRERRVIQEVGRIHAEQEFVALFNRERLA
jgi:hypothetical protein